MSRRALIIDHEACWGCLACEVACKQGNHVDAGVKLIRVLDEPVREIGGRASFTFIVNVCT